MIRKYHVKLVGVTPLLMHWDNIEWADAMDAWRVNPANKKASKAGDDRTPAFRWIGSVYHDGKNVCMFSDNVTSCVLAGGAMVPVPGGKNGKTFKAQTQSGMKIDEAFVTMRSNGKQIPWEPIANLMKSDTSFSDQMEIVRKMGFRLFVKRARIGSSKHIRVRPMFENWELEFGISVWDDQLTKDVINDIYVYGGTYKGLGDWRPSSKTPGSYGMFGVDSLVQA